MMKRTLRFAFMVLFLLNMLPVSILHAAEQKKESISSALSSGTGVEGQAAAAAGAEEAMSITFSDIMARGGWIMYVISGLSLVAIALALFYCMTMRASILFPKKFLDQAKDFADANNFPEPHRDMKPETIEEILVCYADSFFSKSKEVLILW